MATTDLGRLEPVDLREVWPNEESDFTPWLADQKNLAILDDALGMPLEFVAREEAVGPIGARQRNICWLPSDRLRGSGPAYRPVPLAAGTGRGAPPHPGT